ncbi:hypothetical protein AB2B38_012695 [Balneola sp. MJW-20]|uniref:hypothetical protein n=1 Tax=Gracilimonas aurantiaca TaxID=3234185 RepID=UPI0034673110
MGRALLIICAGVFISLGIVSIGANTQTEGITTMNVDYASEVQAKNTALTAIQLAMEEINQDDSWQPTQGSPWKPDIDGANVSFYYDVISAGATYMDPDVIRVYSTSTYGGSTKNIIATYEKQALSYLPEYKSALSFATDQFTFAMDGSSTINGNDRTGTCADLPGVAVIDNKSENEVNNNKVAPSGTKGISGDPDVFLDPTLSYEPVDELVARLENLPTTTRLSGNYKGTLGTADDPGVFFVEDYTKLTGGITEGYGIMVIRTNGELSYEGELDLAGNLTFNGLVIFENAFAMNGRGTPTINGSVLVGNTKNVTDLNVDISGNISLQYDCLAKEYADLAAAKAIKQNRYSQVSMFE